MPILIDGYNLLNATGIVGNGKGAATLERSRHALLNFLAASIDPDEVPRTVVVFDAKDAPPGLPREFAHKGIRVLYAARYGEADDLIEQLIRADHSPRQLIVVSSDHRIQRAANRRRATPIDSEKWYSELSQLRRDRDLSVSVTAKPRVPLSREDVEAWLLEFGDVNVEHALGMENNTADKQTEAEKQAHSKNTTETLTDLDNPFPPGYAEDLLDM